MLLVKNIKNISGASIDFGGEFTLANNEEKNIFWDVNDYSSEGAALIQTMAKDGTLELYDVLGTLYVEPFLTPAIQAVNGFQNKVALDFPELITQAQRNVASSYDKNKFNRYAGTGHVAALAYYLDQSADAAAKNTNYEHVKSLVPLYNAGFLDVAKEKLENELTTTTFWTQAIYDNLVELIDSSFIQ